MVSGRPAARALNRLPKLPDGSPPRLVPLDDRMALVVADVPAEIYSQAALEHRLANPEWVSRCGAAHHAVSEALAKRDAVVPLRFLTLFSTETKAIATLKRSKTRLAETLARVTGREEWVLRIGKPDPRRARAVRAPSRRRLDRPSGTAFLRAKADARQRASERARQVATDAMNVYETVRKVADQATTRPIEPGVNVLLDAALLVEKRKVPALRRSLAQAAAGLLEEGCPISLSGPWPAYSFVSLRDGHG